MNSYSNSGSSHPKTQNIYIYIDTDLQVWGRVISDSQFVEINRLHARTDMCFCSLNHYLTLRSWFHPVPDSRSWLNSTEDRTRFLQVVCAVGKAPVKKSQRQWSFSAPRGACPNCPTSWPKKTTEPGSLTSICCLSASGVDGEKAMKTSCSQKEGCGNLSYPSIPRLSRSVQILRNFLNTNEREESTTRLPSGRAPTSFRAKMHEAKQQHAASVLHSEDI